MEETGNQEGRKKATRGLPAWAKTALVSLLWPAYGLVLAYAFVFIDLDLNLFDWSPTVDDTSYLIFWGTFFLLVGALPLARITREKVSTAVAVLVVVALVALGLYLLPAEKLNPNTLLGRDAASPLWYRGGRAGLLALPALVLGLQVLLGRKGGK